MNLKEYYFKKSKNFDKTLLKMSVEDRREELVSLQEFFDKNSVEALFNKEQITGKDPKLFYLRKSVASALLVAAEEFTRLGYILVIEDAYRSLLQQKQKFSFKVKQLIESDSSILLEEALQIANTYVAGIPLLAAHTAGAAVDVTLIEKDTRSQVDFGCPYHTLDERAVTGYPRIIQRAKKNRKLLSFVMANSGFINYPFEYWHFSIGDVTAAYIKGENTAKYGPVVFDRLVNKLKFDQIKNIYEFFDINLA